MINLKCESSSSRFQLGEGPSSDYEPLDGPSFQSLCHNHHDWPVQISPFLCVQLIEALPYYSSINFFRKLNLARKRRI